MREITIFNNSQHVDTSSIPALLLTTSIAETKIGSMVQSIWESQPFHSVKLKPGQLTVPKEFVGTPRPDS